MTKRTLILLFVGAVLLAGAILFTGIYKSDVIWAAIIASGLTYIGVYLTNKSNKKCLEMQLNQAAEENDKEREQQIRKGVFIEAAEVIAESIEDIQSLPNKIAKTDDLKFFNKSTQALIKVCMVGTNDTVTNAVQFRKEFDESMVSILPEIFEFIKLKYELAGLKDSNEIQANILEEKTRGEYNKLQISLLFKCLEVGNHLQTAAFNVILSIRSDLGLETDIDKFKSQIEEIHNNFENTLSSVKEHMENLIKE